LIIMTTCFQAARPLAVVVVLAAVALSPTVLKAEDGRAEKIPTRCGMSAVWGSTFDPVSDIRFLQLSGFIMWDYDRVWRHRAPEPLRFKVEGTAGATTGPQTRAIISIEMLALYYLDFLSGSTLTPYVEGGIGLIYTDFQVKDPDPPGERQGSRFNFNPLIGIGLEYKPDSGAPFFGTVRLSHISNGGLHAENRGVNAVVLLIGRFF